MSHFVTATYQDSGEDFPYYHPVHINVRVNNCKWNLDQ